MNSRLTAIDPFQYSVPAVKHLAWMVQAPQLMMSDRSFVPSDYLPRDLEARFRAWDKQPEAGPDVLTATPAKRLGHYFESLYECLIEDLLGWTLLGKNLQVQSDGRTLGELDFLILNPESQGVEHHEIAVKFYLGYPDPGSNHAAKTLWYGPNAIDRLDLKTQRMLDHQSRMTERPETQALLSSLNIHGPVEPRIFIPGYLFSPNNTQTTIPLPTPSTTPDNHLSGQWCYLDAIASLNTSRWVPLNKPHWLGPWQQQAAPEPKMLADALEMVKNHHIPRLFAELEPNGTGAGWVETQRWFVVPDSWPGAAT